MSADPHVAVTPPVAEIPVRAVARRPRLWPAVLIVVALWLAIKVPSLLAPATMTQFLFMFWGPIVAAVLLLGWWLFASRLPWSERFLMLGACVAIAAAAFQLYDTTFGWFGLFMYALPVVMTAWVGWLLVVRAQGQTLRRLGLVAVFVLGWGYFALLRMEGVTGGFAASFEYRWRPTAEQRFLEERQAKSEERGAKSDGTQADNRSTLVAARSSVQAGDWPSFRGAERDGRLAGVRIRSDWQEKPPRLVWRHRVGPGWSSFAVVGPCLYTQEQRGEDEVVVCYDADSGRERWVHRDAARFTEVVAGPGPRATPTFHEGKLYALGAAGRLNCLDAASGALLWSRDIVAESGAKVPLWGFASSPLIVDGIVTVVAAAEEKGVLGYRADSGQPAWSAGPGTHSYCSTHRARLAGVEQLLVSTDAGLASFAPKTGEVLWSYDWPLQGMARIVQPALLGDNDVLLGSAFGNGSRRLRVSHDADAWTVTEVWTTKAINPYYNDLVIHKGHLFGFDGVFFTCVSLKDGTRKWRERGYGNGQVLLLADQDLLLVLSEKGEAALVEANPERHRELARFQAIEGKSWNHPVIAHGKLFVRNGEEAACYEVGD